MLQTVTSWTLLEGLKRADRQTVWGEYVSRYRPLLVRHFQRLGIQLQDAEDIAQETLLAFARAYGEGKYDPSQGRLRSWLFGIAHRTLRAWNRQQARAVPATQITQSDELPDVDHQSELWEEDWRDAVLEQCIEEVRREVEPTTFAAFAKFAREGRPAREVAAELGISENAVFGAKRRILRRIRELLPAVEEAF